MFSNKSTLNNILVHCKLENNVALWSVVKQIFVVLSNLL